MADVSGSCHDRFDMSSSRDVYSGRESDEEPLRNAVPPLFRSSPPSRGSRPRIALRWIVLSAATVVLLVGVSLFLGGAFARGNGTAAQETASPESGTALNAARALAVAPPNAASSYDRELFAWRGVDLDRNGCDSRNDVLRRDLVDLVVREGTQGCKVDAGTLAEPYTGTTIFFVVGGGPTNDGGVQIDHVVALANAWASGAAGWDSATLQTFGNDPLNLLAVDGDANQSKGASNAAEWLPPNTAFHCEYVARQVAVKTAYSLSVTASEFDAMERVLAGCPDQPLQTAANTATP